MKWNLRMAPHKEQAQAKQELRILEEDIAAAYSFVRNNCKNYFQNTKTIPIYLILGPSRFGKTTILAQAGLDLINVNNQRLDYVTPTKYCSFWFTQEAIYIDTAGTYTKPDTTKPRHDVIWQGFIKLLQKYFGQKAIAGTLIILDLPAIIQDSNLLKTTLFCIRERIYETAMLVNKVHAHIIFTKCDRLIGFTEFFSPLDPEDRTKPFGLHFTPGKKIDLVADFETKFNKLIKNLNQRIVENLQKSIRPKERPLIKMFPSQLEHLRSIFIEVISKIPHSHHISLSGLYFTSSIQDGVPLNPIKTTLLPVLNLTEISNYNLEASNNHSYFIKELFRKTISLPTTQKKPHLNFTWIPRLAPKYTYWLAGIVTIIGIVTLMGYQNYQQNRVLITQTERALHAKVIDEHEALHGIINHLEQALPSWRLTFGINKIKALHQAITTTHQLLFTHDLAKQVATYLANPEPQGAIDSHKLYHGLKVYLMLGHPEKLEPLYVNNWFKEHWATTYPNATKQQTIRFQQLKKSLAHEFKLELDQHLITATRETLNKLPPLQLIYLLLESAHQEPPSPSDGAAPMATMYTKDNFYKIYNEAIPRLVNSLPQHDWVLGELPSQLQARINSDTVKNIRDLYLEYYLHTWEELLKLEAPATFKNLTDLAEYLTTMATNGSTLLSLVQQIKTNLTLANPPLKLAKELNAKFQHLDTLSLPELQRHLTQVAQYITTIAKHSDPNKAAFHTTITYLRHKPTQHPVAELQIFAANQIPPLRHYLQELVNNTWQGLLDATYSHINQAWNSIIMPQYAATVENKYPLFQDSKEDITLADFNNFFGPHGIIDKFFSQYIEPLVNADKIDWTWKKINGQPINFSVTFLEVFLRAALIQKMFYTTKALHPKLAFSLTPIDMAPTTQSFALHLDGQKILFSNENKKTHPLTWPGPQPGSVTLSFVNTQGKHVTTSEFGPWAWFRVLDKANVTSDNSTRRFALTFDLNGNAARYYLSTTESVNPFIPEIISNFRCYNQE